MEALLNVEGCWSAMVPVDWLLLTPYGALDSFMQLPAMELSCQPTEDRVTVTRLVANSRFTLQSTGNDAHEGINNLATISRIRTASSREGCMHLEMGRLESS